jgi:hypothetical protein
MSVKTSRRRVLRGLVGGAAVSVSLPLLDCFLDGNGAALASGRPMPVRFGTWFWGCGMNPARWTPEKAGAGYDVPVELKPIEGLRDKISVLSGFNVILDGKANHVHVSGTYGARTGTAPPSLTNVDLTTLDVLVADAVGTASRFRSLELTATGDPKHSYSRRSAASVNPSEGSPVAFYTRVFGPEFQDPNAADFKPDPRVMVRQSVLSAVKEDRDAVARDLGAADRARLDDYFTSVRQLENQLELQLQKPPPAEACRVPGKPAEGPVGLEIAMAEGNHRLMAQMLAMALACNQTRVFNMVFSDAVSNLRRPGESSTHHTYTHDEPVDHELGYQPKATWFEMRSMEAWAEFVRTLDAVREGDGTLLDNCLVWAHSDSSFAKTHDILGLPGMIAGRAGGRVRPGIHVKGNGDPVSRIGLTLQQAMGMTVDKWGTGSMQTARPLGELLV